MGLIKSGIKYGSFAYMAHEAGKAVGNMGQQRQESRPQAYPPQQQYVSQGPHRDANGYLHQGWCNGQCGWHCNDQANGFNGNNSRAIPVTEDNFNMGQPAETYGANSNQSASSRGLPAPLPPQYQEKLNINAGNPDQMRKQ